MAEAFRVKGDRHYGEHVSEREHALQAAEFARRQGLTDSLVLACLLHNYGHLLHDLGETIAQEGIDAHHEDLGAAALARWFGREVVEPVRLHVAAKRYLCTVDPAYLAGLSPASRLSLELQGGLMNSDEARLFESHPYYGDAVALRRCDDQAKVPGLVVPGLETYRDLVMAHVRML
ncbi:HD domain-containing protein [Isosphaera pallida]|uniref:HD domain-containing protein n=1 Tax=Isosphaera pallida TaxID=128 RepID=UPI0005C6C224|nr:HD domain-containing protein [Isosphaera pallida]